MRKRKGFTLIELLIVIGIIAVLMAIAIVAINPGKQFAKANNAKRWGDVTAIVDAASMRIVENKGTWPNGTCPALPVAGTTAGCDAGETCLIKNPCGVGETCYNICDCIVDEYLGSLPIDPTATSASWTDCTAYNTGYTFSRTGAGRITISASAQAEDGSTPTISVTR
jgi:type IV pilus assembly protein PilA